MDHSEWLTWITTNALDHNECIRSDIAGTVRGHTHEGQKGFWVFPSDATDEERGEASNARVLALHGKDASPKTARDMAAEIADMLNKLTLDDESPIDTVSLGRGSNITFYTASGQHFFFDVEEVDES